MENRLSADSIAVCGNFDIMGECGGWCSTEKVERAIKGVVLDSDTNEPLIGVNITFKEIKTGTITDVDGNFSLPIDKQRKVYNLVFSYIGYQTKEIACAGNEPLIVKLSQQAQVLDQVVVVGYGVQKKVM